MKCSFCGKTFVGRGKMIVQPTGRITYFCSSKCERNAKLKRDPRKLKWVLKEER